MTTLGELFRTALTALAVCGVLAAGVTAADVMAAGEDLQLEQLWDEFPLDERDEHSIRNQPLDRDSPQAEPPLIQQTTGQGQAADKASHGSSRVAILAVWIALSLGTTGVVLVRSGPLRPRKGTRKAAGRRRRPPRRLASGVPPRANQDRAAEELVNVLAEDATAAQKSKEVKMRGHPKALGQVADRAALKAGRPEMRTAKLASSVAEHEALKLKSASEAELLKAKSARDAVLLKEKLISGRRREQAVKVDKLQAKVGERPIPGRGRGDVGKRRSLRPLGVADSSEPHVGARTRDTDNVAVECEIRWWRGYVNSQFLAVERGAEQSKLAASPPFRWRKNEPPPETPATSSALASLIESFVREGWVVAGRGEEWFALRFRRAPDTQDSGFGRSVSKSDR